jgi:HEAT repeat protein
MKKNEKATRANATGNSTTNQEKKINALVAELGSDDGIARVRARQSLVAIGHNAVRPLVKALTSKQEWCRWEAAKTLAQIGDPAATQALIESLRDKMFDVRWLAAEGLIHIGEKSVRPLLETVIKQPDSLWIREGAHHILHGLPENEFKDRIAPVLRALEDVEPSLEVAVAAEKVLNAIGRK